MLREEEKQAMKYFYNLRATIDESNMLFDEDIDVKCGKETIKQITTILNLIEKQSKEIEELKEKNEYLPNWVNKKYVSKDKIKAKIEDLEKEQEDNRKDLYNAVNVLNFSKMNIISNRICVNMSIKDILRSLLEKE